MEKGSTANASAIRQDYTTFLRNASMLFPKVDQKLLLTMLQYQTSYSDWEGSVMLKIVYPSGTDMEKKKEWIYQKFERMGSIESDRMIRVKVIHMYIDDRDRLLSEDPDIEFVTGSATMAPTEAYSA